MNEQFKDFYSIKKTDFGMTGHVFGRAFKDDPAFYDIFRDLEDDRRDVFFEGPARYCYKYGKIYASSSNIEGMVAWVPSKYADMTMWRIVRSGIVKSTRRVGMKTMLYMKPIFKPLEKARKEHMKGIVYIYVMTLGVDPKFQGKGLGRTLLQSVIDYSNSQKIPIYLETATEKNVDMYKKFGFKVIDTVLLPVINIQQWCMVRVHSG